MLAVLGVRPCPRCRGSRPSGPRRRSSSRRRHAPSPKWRRRDSAGTTRARGHSRTSVGRASPSCACPRPLLVLVPGRRGSASASARRTFCASGCLGSMGAALGEGARGRRSQSSGRGTRAGGARANSCSSTAARPAGSLSAPAMVSDGSCILSADAGASQGGRQVPGRGLHSSRRVSTAARSHWGSSIAHETGSSRVSLQHLELAARFVSGGHESAGARLRSYSKPTYASVVAGRVRGRYGAREQKQRPKWSELLSSLPSPDPPDGSACRLGRGRRPAAGHCPHPGRLVRLWLLVGPAHGVTARRAPVPRRERPPAAHDRAGVRPVFQ